MKHAFAVWVLFGTAVVGQVSPPLGDGPWQDPTVKILGDVAHGPPLKPDPISSLPEMPIPNAWGPRSFYANGQFLNNSARGYVSGNDIPLIGGFVVSSGNRVVLIRGVGPTLASYGVSGALQHVHLELFDSKGRSVAVAVPWGTLSVTTQTEIVSATTTAGAFPLKAASEDAVLLAYLNAGSYTCVIFGTPGSSGNVLLEVYNVPTLSTAAPFRAVLGGDKS